MYFHTDEVLIYPGPGLYKENRLSCVSLQVLNYPTHNYVSMLVFKKWSIRLINQVYFFFVLAAPPSSCFTNVKARRSLTAFYLLVCQMIISSSMFSSQHQKISRRPHDVDSCAFCVLYYDVCKDFFFTL